MSKGVDELSCSCDYGVNDARWKHHGELERRQTQKNKESG